MKENVGFGKVILFNEHFVVYGVPAIVSAIDKKTSATIEDIEGNTFELVDNRAATPNYKSDKYEQQIDSIRRIFEAMDLNPEKTPVKITLSGDLFASSGIGASAASCVAIARALSDYFNLNIGDEEINKIAYEGEKGYHGIPSGIDNTAATFGGLVRFEKGDTNIIENLKIKKPVEIIMANTGLVANTTAAVAGVKKRKEDNPKKYAELFKEAKELAIEARKMLNHFDMQKVGELMNINHKLLQEIEVSCPELDSLVKIARDNGAFGAKLTGGGLGGNIVALTPGKDLQENVAVAIEKEGFEVLRTTIG